MTVSKKSFVVPVAAAKPRSALFTDESFLDSLVRLLTTDITALHQCARLLKYDDFKPVAGHRWGWPRHAVGFLILEHWRKHQEPLGALLRAEMLDYVKKLQLGERKQHEYEEYLKHLDSIQPSNPEAVLEKVLRYKEEHSLAVGLEEMVDLAAAGKLTWELVLERSRTAVNGSFHNTTPLWPEPLGPEALIGLVGEFVALVEPETEADPAALALQFLAAFGNIVGRSPHFRVEETNHHTNIYVAIVGATSRSRKGTSWDHVKRRMEGADDAWVARIKSGLVSGEGLIQQFIGNKASSPEDDSEGLEPDQDHVVDNRLMISEPELARVLRSCSRDGSTLSPVLRQGWDSGALFNLTKKSPSETHDAHLTAVGHITAEELRRRLADTDLVNGFANRFLWVCAKRSKHLPNGGHVDAAQALKLDARIRDAVKFARPIGGMGRSKQASALWQQEYPHLTTERPGALGTVTSRAEAQVLRLSLLYALLDKSSHVRTQHLRAALEIWRYCLDSARYIFGDLIGDRLADKILKAFRQAGTDGLSRNEIFRGVCQKNIDGQQITAALTLLEQRGLAKKVTRTTKSTPGRPEERWVAAPDEH